MKLGQIEVGSNIANTCIYVASDTSPLYQILKQSLVEILHFKDLGDIVCHLVANADVLVLGVSNFNNNVPQGGYLPSYKVVFGNDNVVPL